MWSFFFSSSPVVLYARTDIFLKKKILARAFSSFYLSISLSFFSLSPRPSTRIESSNDRASLVAERGVRSKPLMVLFRLSQLQTSEGAKKSCESVGSVDVAGLQDEGE